MTTTELLMKIEAEMREAEHNLKRAQKIDADSDYSDASLSMNSAYEEGFLGALGLVLSILKGQN